MKIRNVVATLTIPVFAALNVMATDALLSPHAMGQQIRTAPIFDSNLTEGGPASAPPRVLDNEVKTVAGKDSTTNAPLSCAHHMSGTPKAIGACAEHSGAAMSCCSAGGSK